MISPCPFCGSAGFDLDLPLTGAELLAWRELRAWSQAELARRIGVNQATVSRAEGRGAATLPPRLRDALTGA